MQPSSSVAHKTVLHHGTHIFSWGRGDLGQLGTERGLSESQPVLVHAVEDKDVAHVAASVFNSAFITGGINFLHTAPMRTFMLARFDHSNFTN